MSVTTAMLECFVAIVDEKGLGNAARVLGVSQPSVSSSLKKLEKQLGVNLFDRLDNGLALTSAGVAVLRPARAAVVDHRKIERLVAAMQEGRSGPMTVAVTVGVSYGLVMPNIVREFTDSRPDARVEIVPIVDPFEAADAVRAGRVDSAIVLDTDVPNDLQSSWLSDQLLVLALPPQSPPVRTMDDVADLGEVRMVSSAKTLGGDGSFHSLQSSGVVPKIVVSGVPLVALPGLVIGGVGGAVMTESMARSVVAAGGFSVPLEPRMVSRATLVYSGTYSTPLVTSFVEQLARRT